MNNEQILLESLTFLKQQLFKYKDKWIESSRSGDTGIGKTFEDLLEKEEDNLALPDLEDLEIKAQRFNSISKVTLFTKAPTYPLRANTYIRNNFGVYDNDFNNIKIIHTSFFGNRVNNYKGQYGFKLKSNNIDKKLYLKIYNNQGVEIDLEKEIYWTYDVLNNILQDKVHNIGFVEADRKKENGKEYFKFSKLTLLLKPSLKKFIENINNGTIQFDIRIGVYRSGKNKGKSHDHGSGFRISKKDFFKLYDIVEEINF
jgi:hypothetical protein